MGSCGGGIRARTRLAVQRMALEWKSSRNLRESGRFSCEMGRREIGRERGEVGRKYYPFIEEQTSFRSSFVAEILGYVEQAHNETQALFAALMESASGSLATVDYIMTLYLCP